MFWLSALGHHQVVRHDQGNYTIYGIIQYVIYTLVVSDLFIFI